VIFRNDFADIVTQGRDGHFFGSPVTNGARLSANCVVVDSRQAVDLRFELHQHRFDNTGHRR
jgi:hypothetical protein